MSLIAKFNYIFEGKNNYPPLICAEMSGNHKGELKSAIKFLRQAKKYGADLLKVQVYRPDTITIDSDKEDFLLDPESPWSSHNNLFNLSTNNS